MWGNIKQFNTYIIEFSGEEKKQSRKMSKGQMFLSLVKLNTQPNKLSELQAG